MDTINRKTLEDDVRELNLEAQKPLKVEKGNFFLEKDESGSGDYMLMQRLNDKGDAIPILDYRLKKVAIHHLLQGLKSYLRRNL